MGEEAGFAFRLNSSMGIVVGIPTERRGGVRGIGAKLDGLPIILSLGENRGGDSTFTLRELVDLGEFCPDLGLLMLLLLLLLLAAARSLSRLEDDIVAEEV